MRRIMETGARLEEIARAGSDGTGKLALAFDTGSWLNSSTFERRRAD
jgi:hypothetical protein